MKKVGIIRKIDELGRIVIPKEFRDNFDMKEGDKLEIIANKEGQIILKKFERKVCTQCNKSVGIEDKYCKYCGNKLKEA